MATTNTYAASLTVAEALDDAWERLGLDPVTITSRHSKSARQSMMLMLASWSNRGILQWTIDEQTKTTTVGMQSFTPADGTIDLLDVILRRDGIDTPMSVMSRQDYHSLPDKDVQGKPNQYFVQRSITPTVYIWPAGENTTDVIRYYRIRQIQDTGSLSTNPDIPVRWFEAFVADLASRLAQKWAPDRWGDLKTAALEEFNAAKMEDRERADVCLSVRMR